MMTPNALEPFPLVMNREPRPPGNSQKQLDAQRDKGAASNAIESEGWQRKGVKEMQHLFSSCLRPAVLLAGLATTPV